MGTESVSTTSFHSVEDRRRVPKVPVLFGTNEDPGLVLRRITRRFHEVREKGGLGSKVVYWGRFDGEFTTKSTDPRPRVLGLSLESTTGFRLKRPSPLFSRLKGGDEGGLDESKVDKMYEPHNEV